MRDTRIPIEIEVIGTEFQKSIIWTATGSAIGTLLAGPVGAVIGGLTQGNGQKVSLRVRFEDRSEKIIECDEKQAKIELIVWAWRIENCKSEQDYVDFGINFKELQRGTLVPRDNIDQFVDLSKTNQGLGLAWAEIQFEMALHDFFEKEIERYFWEKRKESLKIDLRRKGYWIPPRVNNEFFVVLSVIFGIFLLYVGYVNYQNWQKGQLMPENPSSERQ